MLPLFGAVRAWNMTPADIVAERPPPPPSTGSQQMKEETAEVKKTVEHLTGRPINELVALLRNFQGLPHRCELVGTWRGLPVINDSKSTNLESTLVALLSQAAPVVLMYFLKLKRKKVAVSSTWLWTTGV